MATNGDRNLAIDSGMLLGRRPSYRGVRSSCWHFALAPYASRIPDSGVGAQPVLVRVHGRPYKPPAWRPAVADLRGVLRTAHRSAG